ncbi:MAG TPA: zf-HC2 domain-containing protein [Candidatus Limnocylindrales bacterium]|nr:zf-HC2 domain-containing protein [Candidatus Limnocylindrales bacterium]
MKECEEVKVLLDIYLDGEFSEEDTRRIQNHLSTCPSCSEIFEKRQQFLNLIKESEIREEVPPGLELSIRSKLRKAELPQQKKPSILKARSILAGVLLLAGIIGIGLYFLQKFPSGSGENTDFLRAVTRDYEDYLRQELPLEIQSSDREEVIRWFKNKINFNLLLPSFRDKNIKLLGGRLTGFQGERVALIIYELNGNPISLAVTKAWRPKIEETARNTPEDIDFDFYQVDGYTGIYWNYRGLVYCLVSDLPENVNIHQLLDWSAS